MKKIVSFLNDLKLNNNRDWFNDNKDQYLESKAQFDHLIEGIIGELTLIDPNLAGANVKNSVYRIYRDVRFSADKSPYKTHFGAYMAGGGRKSGKSGYYIHIDADQSFLGGGMYSPSGPMIKAIRKEIVDFPEDMEAILADPFFKKYFQLYEKDKLKRAPRGIDEDFKLIDIVKLKHFIASYEFPEAWLAKGSDDFKKSVVDHFKALRPLNDFLNRILTDQES